MGGRGGCDRRIEKFLGKFTKKKNSGGVGLGGGGVRVDVNEELKFCANSKKKKWGGGGVRVDENEELKFFVKIKKKTNIFFFFGGGGQGG